MIDIEQLTTEYLILHENDVDWDALSSYPDRDFSLVEIRLFRKNINWEKYLISHSNILSDTKLEIASKYFTERIYTLLSSFNIATEDFIVRHADKFNFKSVILNCKMSQDALLETMDHWKDLPDIQNTFKESKYIDISQPEYSDIKLVVDTL